MTDWNKAKVVDLRAELKKRGLLQTGLKPALVARLTAAENEEGSESEATVQGDSLKLNASAAASPDTISPTQPVRAEAEPSSESVEEATALEGEHVDTSMEDAPADSFTMQPAVTVEFLQPPSKSEPEPSAFPSVEPQEAQEDRQKRKRRSQTPPLSASEVARKRFRSSGEDDGLKAEVTTTENDSGWAEERSVVDEEEISAKSARFPDGVNVDVDVDVVKADPQEEDKMEVTMESKALESLEDSPSRTRDSRFKDLFPSTSTPQTATDMDVRREKSKSHDSAYDEAEPERVVSPAIHPATAALYIRDFMRPLNPAQLKSHLALLATPPGRDADQNVVVDFYLDPIRTHAFVSFNNISAASRVRSALHDRIWPDERTRKPLWVDFIPLDKLGRWIEAEESTRAGGRASQKKWEVYYDFDEDSHVTATLQEARNVSNVPNIQRTSANISPQAPHVQVSTTLPRGVEGAPSGPRAEQNRDQNRDQNRGQRAANNLATLDQLFRSTVAKPVLYWESVSKSLANKRLDAIDHATSKRYVRGGSYTGAINRYTFDDGDQLVDRGPELFPGIRPPPGFRGPGRGGLGGVRSDRGGYDSYRGGGGGRGGGWRGSRDDSYGRRDSRDDRRY